VTAQRSQAHQVILWDEVGETEGTGIVHIAPGCGAEDFQLGPRAVRPAAGGPAG
jgi:isoleucyl-tRNA synthetase